MTSKRWLLFLVFCFILEQVGCFGGISLNLPSSRFLNKARNNIIPRRGINERRGCFRHYGYFHQPSVRQQQIAARQAEKDKHVINEQILFPNIRVIIPSNDDLPDESLGIISREQALAIAKQRNLDLLLISETATPPVCKIVDYGRYKYAQARKKRDQQKSSNKSKSDMKEIKLSYKIDSHDIEFKQKAAIGFLQEGDRVKVSVNLRGREMQFQNNTAGVLNDFVGKLLSHASISENTQMEGKSMFIILNPKKTEKRAAVNRANALDAATNPE